MTHALGARLHGIATLEDLRQRCVCLDGCWHWRLADGRKPSRTTVHRVWLHGTGTTTVTRAAWHLAGKAPPGDRWNISRACESWDCANPDHLRRWTRQQMMDHQRKIGRTATPAKIAACRALVSASLVITPELRAWSNESAQTGVDVAHALGVSQGRVNVLRAEDRATAARGSVFSLGVLHARRRRSDLHKDVL